MERSYQERGDIGETYGTNRRNEKCLQKFQSKNLDESDHFGNLGIEN
jgi:hypothetical protein